jgi:SAM-dependent methyltransferase
VRLLNRLPLYRRVMADGLSGSFYRQVEARVAEVRASPLGAAPAVWHRPSWFAACTARLAALRASNSQTCSRTQPLTAARAAQRKRALFAQLSGDVVEVGAGAGLNFRLLPPSIKHVTIVEPNEHLARAAHAAARAAGITLQVERGEAERLPLENASADAVICTWVLCTVRDPQAALREIARVLRPGGQFVFLEHVVAAHDHGAGVRLPLLGARLPLRAGWPPLPLWAQQRLLNPVSKARDEQR